MNTATNRIRHVLGSLRCALDGLSDGELLARFVATRDEMAFARLVRTHGPMVLSICRRVLQHAQDAEDAFQATFLILARKGRSVVQGDAVGSWLYRVAYRTAQEARAMRARRRAKEVHVETVPQPEVPAAEPHDWRSVLDQELNLLPAKYQSALVLCDLEARSRRDAAQELGIPEGTLSSRLAHGRKLLAARLARRGVTLGGGALVAFLSESILTAHVPGPLLVAGTAQAAVRVAAGQVAAVSMPVAVLMKGVLKSMFIAKLKTVVGFFALAILTLGFGSAAYQTGGAQQGTPSVNQGIGRQLNELEALRKENELLKLNLQVVLEKVHAQEIELRAYRSSHATGSAAMGSNPPAYSAGPSYPAPSVPSGYIQTGPSGLPRPAPTRETGGPTPAPFDTTNPASPGPGKNVPKSPANPFQEQLKDQSKKKSVGGGTAPPASALVPQGDFVPPTRPTSVLEIEQLKKFDQLNKAHAEVYRLFYDAESDDGRRQLIDALEQAVQRLRQESNRAKSLQR